jgi:hypothetical protein
MALVSGGASIPIPGVRGEDGAAEEEEERRLERGDEDAAVGGVGWGGLIGGGDVAKPYVAGAGANPHMR